MIRLSLGSYLLCSCALIVGIAPALAQTAAPDYEMVVVTASRYEEEAREQQKYAPNIVNVQSAEAILKYPDFNAAESLARMPGISLMADTGEGRFVMIRGIDGNLNGTTYGGVVLLNTNPGGTYQGGGGRAVELDTVPGGAIDGLIVTKSLTPDHDAEGLGGTIELTPRSAANITTPFVELNLGTGFEPIHNHAGPWNAEITLGGRFGFENSTVVMERGQSAYKVNPGFVSNPTPFSFVVSASWREDRRGFDDLEADFITPIATNPAKPLDKLYDDLQMRLYDAHRKRFSIGGEFDFKPNDEHRYYFRASMFGYDEQINKNHLVFNNLSGIDNDDSGFPLSSTGNMVTTQSNITLNGTNSQEIARNNVYVLGGEDDFHVVKIEYRVAYSRATDSSHSYGPSFNGPKGVFVTYDNIDSPNFPTMKVTDGTNLNDPTLYTMSKMSSSKGHDVDEEYSYAGNATIPVDILSSADRLKFGFSVRLRNKDATPYTQTITLPKVKPLLSTLSPLAADTTYYHNRYTNGPHINEGVLLANIQNGTFVPTPFLTDPKHNYWDGKENIYAGYGMYTGEYGSWGFLAGARVEHTVAKYTFFDDNKGFITLPKTYTDVFPSAQLRYEFSSDLIARFAYSTGLARPGFTQVTGHSHVTPNPGNYSISTGNPDLKPITGNDFDLDLEWYLNDSGIFEVGVFDKEFENYIFSREVFVASDPRATAAGWTPADGKIRLDTNGNIPTAYARGIEVSYQQKFTFLPKPFDGLGFDGNFSYVSSSGAARVGESHSLPGTSPTTFNASIFYEADGLSLRLASSYSGHSLYQVGDSRLTEQFEDSRFTVDWTSSYDLCENAQVYFNVKNITNAPLRIYMGAPNWPIQREFYDQTYETGVRLKM